MLNFGSIGLGVLEKQKGVFFSEQSARCPCRSGSLFDWPMSFRWRHLGSPEVKDRGSVKRLNA